MEGHDDDTSELVSKFSEQVSNCSTHSTRALSLSLSNNTDTSLVNFPQFQLYIYPTWLSFQWMLSRNSLF